MLKKLLKYDNYLIDKEKFINYINNADKNSFFESKKSVPFRMKVDHQYVWFETNYPVWLAHYTEKTTYTGDYDVWQLCSNGSVPGIKGAVDINVMYD